MQVSTLLNRLGSLILMVPVVLFMTMAVFGLGHQVATPPQRRPKRNNFCGFDRDGNQVLSDPDGTPCDSRHGFPPAVPHTRMDSPQRQGTLLADSQAPGPQE